LKLHRFAIVPLGLGWVHGVLAGTDTPALEVLYAGLGVAVVGAAVYRYWIVRRRAERAVPTAISGRSAPRSPTRPAVPVTVEASDA
jgi:DMSO/TMAO reductase YedYZ heme-binding membrane subunit